MGALHLAAIALLTGGALVALACGDDGSTTQAGTGGMPPATTTTGATTTGATTTGGAGGAPGCGPAIGLPVAEACEACTAQHCCAQSQACAADSTCDELASCMKACGGDVQCFVSTCIPITQGAFLPAAGELELCALENCEAECSVAYHCEQLEAIQPPACGDCINSQCCDTAQAVYSADYLRYELCRSECLDYPCLADCDALYPAVIDALQAVYECWLGPTCGDTCTPPDACGGIQFAEPTCGACATSQPACCDLFSACSTDPVCINFFNCHNVCTSVAECAECASLFDLASSGFKVAAENCLAIECATCGIGSACGQSHRMTSDGCATCIEQSCCDLGTTCGLDPACSALEMCVLLCDGDAGCASDCEAQFPSAVAAYGDFAACVSASCAGSCP